MKLKHVIAHMKSAMAYAECSTAERRKVGCLVVKDNRPISSGYNGMPPGESNVCECDGHTKPEVRHAEHNAVFALAGLHESARGADVFVTTAPCEQCAIDLSFMGISRVFYSEEYRDVSGIKRLLRKGISVFKVDVREGMVSQVRFSPKAGDLERLCTFPVDLRSTTW